MQYRTFGRRSLINNLFITKYKETGNEYLKPGTKKVTDVSNSRFHYCNELYFDENEKYLIIRDKIKWYDPVSDGIKNEMNSKMYVLDDYDT